MSSSAPTLIWRPAHAGNFAVGRTGQKVSLLVVHIMGGTLEGTAAWFGNPAAKVSAHYGVGKTAVIHQYVRDQNTAWHAGLIQEPHWTHLRKWPDGRFINPNAYSIGLEFEGRAGDAFTPQQYGAGARLIAWLCAKHGINLSPATICRHSDISPKSRPGTCPGAGCDLNRLIEGANAILNA